MAEATVSTKHKVYDELLPDIERNRAVVAGERTIKKGRLKYLPALASMYLCRDSEGNLTSSSVLSAEGLRSYNKYLSLAYFYGATGRTVDGLTGLIYTKPPAQELPASISYIDENADGKGNSLRKISEDMAKEAFITPRFGILTDYPQASQNLTIAQAEALNHRPKILLYKFESIINWHYSVVDNQLMLSLIVLKEKVTKRSGFAVEDEVQYRVLELIDGFYHQSIYNEDEEQVSPPIPILVNGEPSKEIPFYFVEVGTEGKSIINDLADANLNHYRFFADYAAKEHASAFPIFFETGAADGFDNVAIGPNAKWENPNEAATFGVLQTNSDGGSMRNYLLDMESRMAALGAEMLKPRISGAESAESKSLDQVAQNSTVGSVAINVSEALTKALRFAAKWAGDTTSEVFYKLNTDYNPKGLTGQDLTALVSSWQQGAISYETLFDNLQRGEIANPTRSAEDELEQITIEGTGM